jgi:hypothetical protein
MNKIRKTAVPRSLSRWSKNSSRSWSLSRSMSASNPWFWSPFRSISGLYSRSRSWSRSWSWSNQ